MQAAFGAGGQAGHKVVELIDLCVWVAHKSFAIHWVGDRLALGRTSPVASHCTHICALLCQCVRVQTGALHASASAITARPVGLLLEGCAHPDCSSTYFAGKQNCGNLPRFCACAGFAAFQLSGSTVAQLLSQRAALNVTLCKLGDASPREACCSKLFVDSSEDNILTSKCCTGEVCGAGGDRQ